MYRKGSVFLKKKLIDKAVSIIAAAALSCTSVIGSVGSFAAHGSEKTSSAETETKEEGSELVTVIVKVSGDAVLTTPEGEAQGSDFLDTEEAVQMAEELESTQSYVQREIRKLYPEMQVKYSYSVLYNGFSCEIPEDLIDAVKALPYVEDVTKSVSYAVPQMANAPSLSDIPAYYDATGCYGEGTVVCVIDTELDYTHPMFAPLDEEIETVLKPEDIAEIAAGIGFNVEIDPERAYLSNKLPYVIDYVDDPHDGVWDDDLYSYHGTHVSGIAAGNEFTDEKGEVISGIAKNAQLIFMAVGMGGPSVDIDAALAATEDAVKLHADVINMSFGGEGEVFDNPLYDAYFALEKAGVIICNSSGNSGDGALYGDVNFTSNPDVGTTNNVPGGTKIMTIASAGNTYTQIYHSFSVEGELIPFVETGRSYAMFDDFFMDDELEGEYEYVFCGGGTEEEIAELDLAGRIAVMEPNYFMFPEEQIMPVQLAGAVGVIFFASEGDEPIKQYIDSEIPTAFIGYEESQKMLEAENKTLTFTGEIIRVDVPTKVSDFSSWGVKHCLELEPDIMGIGGHVKSAAYGEGTLVLDGTSMSSPYVAGCVAVTLDYLAKQGIELEGEEKIAYVRNLLMNSATLYTDDDGLYITPRRQGAGLVNLNNMISDKVVMTNNNDAKINLYDNIGDSFEFDVDLTNLSDEDVEFESARLVLTTNDYSFDEFWQDNIISSDAQIALECSADVSALTSVAAGESRTEHVSVSLDPAQTASLSEVYTNGFFVEGYLILEGADNNCDISVPILGYYGDWAQIPIFGDFRSGAVNLGGDAFMAGASMAELVKAINDIMAQIPEEELADEDADLAMLADTYATEEQQKILWDPAVGDFYISPNGDGLADTFGIGVENLRYARAVGLNIYNEKGELISEGESEDFPIKRLFTVFEIQDILSELADGKYTAEVSAVIDYASSYEAPQTVTYDFTVDTAAPEVKAEVREEKGRKILKLTATDTNLDGIYVTGTGNGGIYGVYDPENAPENKSDIAFAIECAKDVRAIGAGFEYSGYNTLMLPAVGKIMADAYTDADLADIDFTDIITAEPDKKGVYTVEYDITDLTEYSFTVTDKAFNYTEYATEKALAGSIKPGIYTNSERVFCFDEDTIYTALFQNGERTETKYAFKDGKLVVDGKTSEVYQINSRVIKLVSEDGSVEMLSYQGEGALEDYHFYTIDQLVASAVDTINMMLPGFPVTRVETSQVNNIVSIKIYVEYGGEEIEVVNTRFDNTTGKEYKGFDPDDPGLFPVTLDDIAEGVWIEMKEDGISYWDFDNSVIISQEDKSEEPFSYTINNTEVVFDLGGAELTAKVAAFDPSFAMITWEDGTVSSMYLMGDSESFKFYSNDELGKMAAEFYAFRTEEEPEMTEVSVNPDGSVSIKLSETVTYIIDPITGEGTDENGEYISIVPPKELPDGAYTLEELMDMAMNDYEKKTGVRPEGASADIKDDNTVIIIVGDFVDDELVPYEYYIVDPMTGEGVDSAGEEVDLPQTGNNAPAAAVMAAVAVFMVFAGAFAVIGSGVLRRKRNED